MNLKKNDIIKQILLRREQKVEAKALRSRQVFEKLDITPSAKALKPVFFESIDKDPTQPVELQMQQIRGELEFGKGLYANEHHEQLMQGLTKTRKQFAESEDTAERREIAHQEFALWNNYIAKRQAELPEEYHMKDGEVAKLKEGFSRFSERRTQQVPSEKLLFFHSEYVSSFRFSFPLHPKNLMQMLHPYHGYLCHIRGRSYSFQELMTIYERQIISSYERSLGSELLADELACHSYWTIFDEAGEGSLPLSVFLRVMQALRFDFTDETKLSDLQSEFSFLLRRRPGELPADTTDNQAVLRFDLAREIFLERNL